MSVSSVPFKNSAWVGIGTFVGVSLGGVKNLLQKGSIFVQPRKPKEYTRYPGAGLISDINAHREQFLYGGMTPGFNAGLLFAATILGTWNVFTGKDPIYSRISKETCTLILEPLATSISTLLIGRGIRELLERQIPKCEKLDISGHAISQFGITVHMIHTLEALSNLDHSIQHFALSVFAGLISLTDTIFMYNTIAYNHSVIDVTAGFALGGIGYAIQQTAVSWIKQLF